MPGVVPPAQALTDQTISQLTARSNDQRASSRDRLKTESFVNPNGNKTNKKAGKSGLGSDSEKKLLFLKSQFFLQIVDIGSTFTEMLVSHDLQLQFDVGFNTIDDQLS